MQLSYTCGAISCCKLCVLIHLLHEYLFYGARSGLELWYNLDTEYLALCNSISSMGTWIQFSFTSSVLKIQLEMLLDSFLKCLSLSVPGCFFFFFPSCVRTRELVYSRTCKNLFCRDPWNALLAVNRDLEIGMIFCYIHSFERPHEL